MALVMGQPNESDALYRRIQELEREVQEKDKALKQEKQRALQQNTDSTMPKEAVRGWHVRQETERPMQEQDRKMRHALERGVEVHKIEPRDTKRRRQRNLKREGHIRRRQRALQQARYKAIQRAKEREKEALERARELQQERDRAIQRAEERDKQARERASELQEERNRALVQASERMSALLQEKSRSMQLELGGTQEALEREEELRQQRDSVIQWAEERDKKARERDKQAQERQRALQQERDKSLRQAWEREKAVKQERDVALQRLQEIDPLLQPSTLGDFIKECHVSLFSKLTIEPNAGRGSDVTTTNLRGTWQPEKVMQWTDFLSQQRLIFDKVCEVFPSELRAFPRPTTVRENGTEIVPIADEKTLEKFIDVSIAEPVKNIIKQLQSVDKLGRVCRGDVGIDFIIHADHAKPLEMDTTPSRPVKPEPVRTRYCIYRNGTTSMATATSLYVWEPKRCGRQPHSEKWQPGRKSLPLKMLGNPCSLMRLQRNWSNVP
ncbi:hypothetical protein E4U12_005109 [Claviceps purpurea]|nr:hypothetical protein E4U12_005109 [Claviceps purpurea]